MENPNCSSCHEIA
jgi:hypothetical protein